MLNFCPTGLVSSREDSPHIPLTPREIVDDVEEALGLGITLVHLHARDENGVGTSSAEVFEEIILGIREICREVVICVSLSGRRSRDVEHRCAPLSLVGKAKPDMASLTPGSLNFAREASITDPEAVSQIAERCLVAGVVPELEIFDLGMANAVKFLAERELLYPPFYANLILGGPFVSQATLLEFGTLLTALPPDVVWAGGGIGRSQTRTIAMALAGGGGVRVGLEDNLFFDLERKTLATNRQLLERAIRVGRELGREPMRPADFRERMKLGAGNGDYGRKPVNM